MTISRLIFMSMTLNIVFNGFFNDLPKSKRNSRLREEIIVSEVSSFLGDPVNLYEVSLASIA